MPEVFRAEVAELVDAQASGVCGPKGHVGSTPTFRTILTHAIISLPEMKLQKIGLSLFLSLYIAFSLYPPEKSLCRSILISRPSQ